MAVRGHYNLRESIGRNYRELCSVKLPIVAKVTEKLYPTEVVEHDGSRVRIHYLQVGYDDSTDEWRYLADLVQLRSPLATENNPLLTEDNQSVDENNSTPKIQPYNLYDELRIKIKPVFVYGRKQFPSIMNIGFDVLLFKDGLEAVGKAKCVVRGSQHYQLANYRDLDSLLGPNWHYRRINGQGDYGYAILATVEYHRVLSIYK